MEKLMHVIRLRMTDEMRVEVRRYMALDDRESFDETVRHLLRVGLETKMARLRNGSDVEPQPISPRLPTKLQDGWSGVERRRRA